MIEATRRVQGRKGCEVGGEVGVCDGEEGQVTNTEQERNESGRTRRRLSIRSMAVEKYTTNTQGGQDPNAWSRGGGFMFIVRDTVLSKGSARHGERGRDREGEGGERHAYP